MFPSTRSEKMNSVIVMVPQKNSPRGKNTSAPATEPAVPISVTASGLTPSRIRNAANGVRTRVKKARAYLLSMAFRTAPISLVPACGAVRGRRPDGSAHPAHPS